MVGPTRPFEAPPPRRRGTPPCRAHRRVVPFAHDHRHADVAIAVGQCDADAEHREIGRYDREERPRHRAQQERDENRTATAPDHAHAHTAALRQHDVDQREHARRRVRRDAADRIAAMNADRDRSPTNIEPAPPRSERWRRSRRWKPRAGPLRLHRRGDAQKLGGDGHLRTSESLKIRSGVIGR